MFPKIRAETFAPADATWLRMDSPTNLMMITGIMMFDEPLDMRRLREVITHRLLRHARFTQRARRPATPLGRPFWETDPRFNLDAHIHRIGLPAPGDVRALQELAGNLMGEPLDFNKPLWHLHVVENFGSGSAIIVRLHHCIADGLALMELLLSLADQERDAPAARPGGTEKPDHGLLDSLLRPAVTAVSRTLQGAQMVAHEGLETLLHPAHGVELAKRGADGAAALGKLLLTLPDRRTIFRGQCGVTKKAAWSLPIPLERIKRLGKGLGGTVNDVLLATVSGALRRYLELRGQPTEGLDIRTMVPVNLRKPAEMDTLGNRFGLIILSLPVGVRDPHERLAVLKQRMDEIKRTPEALVAFGILNTIGLTPHRIEKVIVEIFAAKVSAIMTNVPGPMEPLYLAGSRINCFMFWVPAAANLGLGISILSYAGEVTVGFATDAGLVPDPETLIACFHLELEALGEHTGHETSAENRTAVAFCQALTRAGQPCKNRAKMESGRCRVHEKQDPGFSEKPGSSNSDGS